MKLNSQSKRCKPQNHSSVPAAIVKNLKREGFGWSLMQKITTDWAEYPKVDISAQLKRIIEDHTGEIFS